MVRDKIDGNYFSSGYDHPDTLISMNNMGILLQVQGKLADAEPGRGFDDKAAQSNAKLANKPDASQQE